MTLKEEIYQAVHDYLKQRIAQLSEEDEYEINRKSLSSNIVKAKLNELLKVQNLIYKMFADYNEKLAQQTPTHDNL